MSESREEVVALASLRLMQLDQAYDAMARLERQLAEANAAKQSWALKVLGLEQLVRDMDMQAQKDTDTEGAITSYRFNTGAWHRLLGILAGAAIPAYIQSGLAAERDEANAALAEAKKGLRELSAIWPETGHAGKVAREALACIEALKVQPKVAK